MATDVNKNNEIVNKLLDMCVEIYASDALDWEVTLGGNGTNASEAINVAKEILNIIGVKSGSKKFIRLVDAKVMELKKEQCEGDFD